MGKNDLTRVLKWNMISQTDERKRPKISVIVPAYNVAPYLAACLDSLLVQTFEDFELILVEDGSTDDTLAIAEQYAERDARIRLSRHRWNEGLAATLNLGLELSRGRYVAFVDSDDLVVPEYLETLYHEAVATKADVVAAGYQEFQKQPGVGDKVVRQPTPTWLGSSMSERVHALMPPRVHIAQWCKLYRRELLNAHRLAFVSTPLAPDLTFHVKCLLVAKRYRAIPQILYHYRLRPDSMDRVKGLERAKRYAVSMARFFEDFAAWMQKNPLVQDGGASIQRQATQLLYMFGMIVLQNLGKTCGVVDAFEIIRDALAEEPCEALHEAMLYAAVRSEFYQKDLNIE